MRHLATFALAVASLAMAACAAVATAPGTPTPTPTPLLAALPTPAPVGGAATGVTLTIDPGATTASYHAREQLAGQPLPSDAVGTSTAVNGVLVLSAESHVLADQSQISVDLTGLQSNESRRDNFIKANTLQVSRYPSAVFVPREVAGLASPLPADGQATFQLSGDLTVHGVTRPVTWQVTANLGPTTVSGTATTNVNISDFGMTPPRVGPVLGIEDALRLELTFSAARAA